VTASGASSSADTTPASIRLESSRSRILNHRVSTKLSCVASATHKSASRSPLRSRSSPTPLWWQRAQEPRAPLVRGDVDNRERAWSGDDLHASSYKLTLRSAALSTRSEIEVDGVRRSNQLEDTTCGRGRSVEQHAPTAPTRGVVTQACVVTSDSGPGCGRSATPRYEGISIEVIAWSHGVPPGRERTDGALCKVLEAARQAETHTRPSAHEVLSARTQLHPSQQTSRSDAVSQRCSSAYIWRVTNRSPGSIHYWRLPPAAA
jgi:hypothetical protein